MALHKKGKRPPNPDPESYIWVDTKEGGFWRKKRGLVKGAMLNTAYSQSRENTKICSPAASRIVRKLRAYMEGLQPGRITVRVCGKLRKCLNETGKLNMNCLLEFDLQPQHPFDDLLKETIYVEQDKHKLTVRIAINKYTIPKLNKLVTHYYFELVLLYGDTGKDNALRAESEESVVYEVGKDYKQDCRFSIAMPEKPWIALLKVSCIEGNEPAVHPKFYGMKVIAASV